MIRNALVSDKKIIYRHWKEYFSFDDGGSIDFFFRYLFKEEDCYVYTIDGEIATALMAMPHDLSLHKKRIRISFISGVYTVKEHRRQGYMRLLLDDVLTRIQSQELITLLQAYTPEVYMPFGFEKVYYKNRYTIRRGDLKKVNTDNVFDSGFKIKELVDIYEKFSSHFTGYYIRDYRYFEIYLKSIVAENKKIIVYRTKGVVVGYAVYQEFLSYLNVDEIVYLDASCLISMLSYLLEINNKIKVMFSLKENINRLIPKAEKETELFMMARINDYRMFNRLFDCQVDNVKDAFKISGLPLFINEFY